MNVENNNQVINNPLNTEYPVKPSESLGGVAPVVPQSENGQWIAVDANQLSFTVSGDMNKPTLGPDGAYYCISNSRPEYNSILSNENTAIPTPSNVVQLPAIVQPIALVPYASQNQPLLQYDPNYRPKEPETPVPPKYRLKPYRGISFVQILCSIAIVAMLIMLFVVDGKANASQLVDWSTYKASGLDTIYGLLNIFGLATIGSVYYDKMLQAHFSGGISAAFDADFLLTLCYILIPIFVALIILISIILVIFYLTKLGKQKSPRGFSVGALLNLLLSGCIVAMVYGIAKIESMKILPGIMMYIVCGISLFMIILNYFARKNAFVLDETALKRVYIMDPSQVA